jgi:O-6-methylguanine DNA methyltransferase
MIISKKEKLLSSKNNKATYTHTLKATCLKTPFGQMLAIADDKALYFLDFIDNCNLEPKVQQLASNTDSSIALGYTKPIYSIQSELEQYFNGTLKQFKTPLFFVGSAFQKSVWQELVKTPLGHTRSYAHVANALGKPTAYRAVAQANGANKLLIIVPCHRIIQSNGALGGYSSGGTLRKERLINHEREMYCNGRK